MQETCNKTAVTARKAATLTVNWTIERMPMRSSQKQASNIDFIAMSWILVLHRSSVLSS